MCATSFITSIACCIDRFCRGLPQKGDLKVRQPPLLLHSVADMHPGRHQKHVAFRAVDFVRGRAAYSQESATDNQSSLLAMIGESDNDSGKI